jgi:hypothetical protein
MAEKKENVQVTVREGMHMPLPNGGTASGGDTVTVPADYYPKISYMVEAPDPPKAKK